MVFDGCDQKKLQRLFLWQDRAKLAELMDGPFTICHQFYNRMSNTVGTAETAYTNVLRTEYKAN